MIWAAISGKGYVAHALVDGNLDNVKYREILKNHLYPAMVDQSNSSCSGNKYPLVFMQDGAPAHTAKVTKKDLQVNADEIGFEILDWPSLSPDLNPIENVWALYKKFLGEFETAKNEKELAKRVDSTFPQFCKEHLISSGKNQPEKNVFRHFCESMPRRLKAVIALKGGATKY